MFRNRRTQVAVAAVPEPIYLTKDLIVCNAQISLAEIEFVPRFIVMINGIAQRQEREADMHLRIHLRQSDGKTPVTFNVSATQLPRIETNLPLPWQMTGLEGLLQSAFKFFGVNSLSKLNGRLVRVLTDEHGVWAIGDYLEDRWFTRLGDQSGRRPNLLASAQGEIVRLKEVYVSEGTNARIKHATLVPGKDGMQVVVKLTDICVGPGVYSSDLADFAVRFHPKTMESLTELLNKLCEVGGVAPGNFERLSGRLVRFHHLAMGDVSFSSADREAARHFFIKHPVKQHAVDMAPYDGVKETV